MSVPNQSKNVNRIRTFAKDEASAREENKASDTKKNILPEVEEVPKNDEPVLSTQVTTSQKKITVEPVQKMSTTPVPEKNESVHKKVTAVKDTVAPKYNALSTELSQTISSHKKSILTDDENGYDENQLDRGTIIRDIKHKRFKLFPAMFNATVSWFTGVQKTLTESKKPTHTMEKAEARVSVIQKAASQSEFAPKKDFEKVAEQLKKIERKPISVAPLLKAKVPTPEPTWGHTLEKSTIESESLQKKETVTHSEEVTSLEDEATPVVEKSESAIEKVEAQAISKIPAAVPISPEVAAPTQVTPSEPMVPIETISSVPAKESTPAQPIKTQVPTTQRIVAKNKPQTTFPVYLLIGVILCTSLLGIGVSFYFLRGNSIPQEKPVTVYEVPSPIQAQHTLSFILPTGRVGVLNEILTLVQSSTGVTQIYPTQVTEQGDEQPVAAALILSELALQAPGSFIRSVKEITFGGIDGATPFIIFKTTSFDTSFAGMLEWEKTMSADLSPLFGNPVTETFDSTARTVTLVHSAFFKDTVASNKNVRLLLDEKGEDRIVYTFVNQNTLVITTTRQSLERLLQIVK